ncbi:MAG: DUF4383 domain-containing protein [Rhodospirillaceae bacterium]|nr:DUF4383 domain-containing protein [Rhodospirillales bacterium]
MRTRYFALIMGIGFLAVGILGFVPRLLTAPEGQPSLMIEAGHGNLFGLFPVNVLLNLVHLIFGIWGVVVWRAFAASRVYSRSVAIIYGVLTIMGLIPGLHTVFGLVPLHGNDIWLHAIIAIAAGYFGYASVPAVESSGPVVRRP